MNEKRVGKRTVALSHPPSVISYANIGGNQESQGPLASYFDELSDDSFFGEKTWEKGESAMQKKVVQRALDQAKLKPADLDYICAGDLLNQCTAERQYLMPVPYGNQRPPTAQWTATAAGCTILADDGPGPYITHITCGKIVDRGIGDVNNMGAAMAPAAYDSLAAFFRDTETTPKDYDLVITGDLGELGHSIVRDFFSRDGVDLGENFQDCGLLLYDRQAQDMHAGASGCGCSASVLNGYLLTEMRRGRWKRILFAPTGALLSPTSSFQGESIPGICHVVCISTEK